MPFLRILPVGLLLLASLFGEARGQTVLGRVTEAPSGAPVPSVLVELLAPDSTRVARVLSGSDGRFVLEAPAEGDYLVRLRRLGYRTSVLGPVAVAGGTTRVDPSLPAEPVELDALVATGRSRCTDDRRSARQTALLWEQIAKALEVTRVVQEDALMEFELLRFVREMDRERSILWREGQDRWRSSNPFLGVDPSVLGIGGFVQPEGEGLLVYHVPEPNVLLSNTFLAGHCFHVVERDGDPGVLGLAFEPRDDRPSLPDTGRFAHGGFRSLVGDDGADVAGTLWIDRESGALETLEYRYVGFRDEDLEDRAGGYARFERLAGGLWVIRQWWVRMPILEAGPAVVEESPFPRFGGIREDGGYLVDAARADGAPATRRRGVRVTGRLIPGDLGLPLESTVVRLSGSDRVTRPDADGRFTFSDVPAGRYLATWHAPRLDSIGFDPPLAAVRVGDEPPPSIELRGLDRDDVLDVVCPGMDGDDDEGVLLVVLHRADVDGSGESSGVVNLRAVNLPGWSRERASSTGAVRFCELPAGILLEVSVDGLDARAEVRIGSRGFHRVDLPVDPAPTPTPSRSTGGSWHLRTSPGSGRLPPPLSRPHPARVP